MQADAAGEVIPFVGMDVVFATLGLTAPEDELVRMGSDAKELFHWISLRLCASARECSGGGQLGEPCVGRRLKAEG